MEINQSYTGIPAKIALQSLVLVLSLSLFLTVMYACTKPEEKTLPELQNGIMYAIEYNGNTQPAIYFNGTWVDPFTLDTIQADTYHTLTEVAIPTLISE